MDQLNPTQQKKAYGLITTLFILFFFMPNMALMNPALNIIAQHFNVDAGQASYITSIPAIAQLVLAVLAGFIAGKKISFKSLIIICLAGITIFGALPGLVPMSFGGLLVCRGLYGFFLGGIQPMVNAAVIMHFRDKNERAKVLGYTNVGFNLGIVIFLMVGGMLAGFGWKTPFYAYFLGAIVIVVVLIGFKEPPKDILTTKPADGQKAEKVKIPFAGWAFMVGFCILNILFQPIMMLGANIMDYHQLGSAGVVGTVMSVGNIFGAIAVAFFGTMFKIGGKWLLAITVLIETIGFACLAFGASIGSFWVFVIAFVVAGTCNSIMSAGTPHFISISISPAAYTVAMGFFAAIFNLGSFLGSPFIQFSMSFFKGSMDFANVFWVSAILGIVLFVFYLFLAIKFKFVDTQAKDVDASASESEA